jgi:hypothetical protein
MDNADDHGEPEVNKLFRLSTWAKSMDGVCYNIYSYQRVMYNASLGGIGSRGIEVQYNKSFLIFEDVYLLRLKLSSSYAHLNNSLGESNLHVQGCTRTGQLRSRLETQTTLKMSVIK